MTLHEWKEKQQAVTDEFVNSNVLLGGTDGTRYVLDPEERRGYRVAGSSLVLFEREDFVILPNFATGGTGQAIYKREAMTPEQIAQTAGYIALYREARGLDLTAEEASHVERVKVEKAAWLARIAH